MSDYDTSQQTVWVDDLPCPECGGPRFTDGRRVWCQRIETCGWGDMLAVPPDTKLDTPK